MFAHKRNICGTKINVHIRKIILRALKYIICKSQMFPGAIENVSGIFPQSDSHNTAVSLNLFVLDIKCKAKLNLYSILVTLKEL